MRHGYFIMHSEVYMHHKSLPLDIYMQEGVDVGTLHISYAHRLLHISNIITILITKLYTVMGYLEINFSLFIKQSLNCGCFVCFDLELLPTIGKQSVGHWGYIGHYIRHHVWLIQLFYWVHKREILNNCQETITYYKTSRKPKVSQMGVRTPRGVRTLHWASVIVILSQILGVKFWYLACMLVQVPHIAISNKVHIPCNFTKIRRGYVHYTFSGEKCSLIPWPPLEIKTIAWVWELVCW